MGIYHFVCAHVCVCLSGEGYWVGKASLRSWRQLALEQLEEDEHETKYSNGQTNGQGPHINNSKGRRNGPNFVSPSVSVKPWWLLQFLSFNKTGNVQIVYKRFSAFHCIIVN